MSETTTQQSAAELGRALVATLAPGELPLFGAISRAILADPNRAKSRRGRGDEILGFGLGEAAALLSPAVLTAASLAVTYLTDEMGKTLTKIAADYVAEEVRRLVRREQTAVRLDDAQLGQVRAIALDVARRFKLPKAQASLLADALVGHLAAGRSA
jgi:hypothetical protein